jgi:hypothetical protein
MTVAAFCVVKISKGLVNKKLEHSADPLEQSEAREYKRESLKTALPLLWLRSVERFSSSILSS